MDIIEYEFGAGRYSYTDVDQMFSHFRIRT
jgi:hypothetical protein